MYKIIASDMDGTLLTPEHKITPYTKEVLSELHNQDYIFVFATGRHHLDVNCYREMLDIPAYMVTSNGARIHDANNTEIFKKNVSAKVIKSLVALIYKETDIEIHIYTNDSWYLNREVPKVADFSKQSGFCFNKFSPNNPPTENVAKIFLTNDSQKSIPKLLQLEKQIKELFPNEVYVAFSNPWCLEIMASGVNKGSALEKITKKHNLTLNNCLAFGDGMNDIEMLARVKKGLIMQTAAPRVKKAAPTLEVIGACTEEAVAHYLAKNLL